MAEDAVASDRAVRLRDAAFVLARDEGLAALTARALAKATGMNPAAVNYYFGNRDLLIAEIGECAIEASQRWRVGPAAADRQEAPPWLALHHMLTGLLQSRLAEGRALLSLIQELEQDYARVDGHAIHPLLIGEAAAEAAFWRGLAIEHGETPHAADAWSGLALGLTGLMLSEAEPARQSFWIGAAAERLHLRLHRRPITLIERGGPDARLLATTLIGNETAHAIIDSALSVIAEKGPERLAQREVAQRAGVSLAAVTYFFRTKSALVAAAFVELCRRHCVTLSDEMLAASGRSAEELLSFQDEHSLQGMAAMETMLRASARSTELAPTASLIRQTRGVASLVLLRRLGLQVDHLDAYIWACLAAGRYRTVRFLPRAQQQIVLGRSTRQLLETLFDWRS